MGILWGRKVSAQAGSRQTFKGMLRHMRTNTWPILTSWASANTAVRLCTPRGDFDPKVVSKKSERLTQCSFYVGATSPNVESFARFIDEFGPRAANNCRIPLVLLRLLSTTGRPTDTLTHQQNLGMSQPFELAAGSTAVTTTSPGIHTNHEPPSSFLAIPDAASLLLL